MRPLLLLAATLLLGSAATPSQPADVPAAIAPTTAYAQRMLDARQASADVALMRRALETIHPGLYRYRSKADIDAAFARLEQVARKPVSEIELWRAIAVMLSEIHCDHTKPEMSDALDTYRSTHPTHLPLRFDLIEGRMIVVSHDGQAGAPPVGSEVVAINGMPVPQAIRTLGKAVAYDGTTDAAIAAKLSSDSDLMGDDFNTYWPAFYGFADHWDLEVRTAGAARPAHVTLAPIGFRDWTALPWPGGGYRDEFYKAITWRIAGKSAYLRIDTLVNYRNPVDATAFLGGFFKSLKAAGVDHLILDLRQNGGGSEDVSVALGRYLLPTTFTWSKPVLLKAIRYGDLPKHIESWGDRKELFEPPLDGFRRTADGWWERLPRPGVEDDESVLPQTVSPDRFSGRVTVLIGARNGSGATRTIAQLKEGAGARLVGEDASGSAEGPTAGHIFLLTLPNSGIKVRIPNAWNRTNIAHFTPGRGVAADDVVVETLMDFEAGADRAFALAKDQPILPAPALATVFAGTWTGTLDYRDFKSDGRVILPTGLTGGGAGDEASLALAFDDGPGKRVTSAEKWSLSSDHTQLTVDGDAIHVIERRGGAASGDLTLVAEGKGEENGRSVEVRVILSRRGETLVASRLTREAGEAFLLRHAYRLHREGAAPSAVAARQD